MIVAHYTWLHGLDDFLVLEQHLAMKDAGVFSHYAQVLVLGNLVDPHVEAFGDRDFVGFLIRPCSRLACAAPIVNDPRGM